MKYVTFSTVEAPEPRLGVVHGDRVIALRGPDTLLDLIRGGPALWRQVAEQLEAQLRSGDSKNLGHRGQDVRWHAPIPRVTKNVFCVGRNYASHAAEVRTGARNRGEDPRDSDVLHEGPDDGDRPVRRHPVGPLDHRNR